MRVLKIVAEGLTTSFRYPYFMQQVHPSLPMPPPATIYGHICSALGEWVDPDGVQFAYQFTYQGKVRDLEHIILLSASTGHLPGTKIPKVLAGKVNPFQRELLFKPRLTLYINRPDWEPAFHSPRYLVVLGRSQDLFTYTHVGCVELEQAEHAYFEHTLAPHAMAFQATQGITVLMPRFLDYGHNRAPSFAQYLVIRDRIFSTEFLHFAGQTTGPYWTDPTTPEDKGMHLGLPFHSFVGNDHENFLLA